VPADIMRTIKTGPNVVVTFDPPAGERFNVDYAALPERRELALKMLTPWGRASLPAAPSAATVLVRSLMANRNHFERHIEPGDWLLMPPTRSRARRSPPPGASWQRSPVRARRASRSVPCHADRSTSLANARCVELIRGWPWSSAARSSGTCRPDSSGAPCSSTTVAPCSSRTA